MNWIQKTFLWIGIAVIVIMGIFPPWAMSGQGAFAPEGYSFILNPPTELCHINTSRLYVQWTMVAVVTGGLILTFKNNKKN